MSNPTTFTAHRKHWDMILRWMHDFQPLYRDAVLRQEDRIEAAALPPQAFDARCEEVCQEMLHRRSLVDSRGFDMRLCIEVLTIDCLQATESPDLEPSPREFYMEAAVLMQQISNRYPVFNLATDVSPQEYHAPRDQFST